MNKKAYVVPVVYIVDTYIDAILASDDEVTDVFSKDPYDWYD